MLSTFIENLKKEYNKSYTELSEFLDIPYRTIIRMKNNEINNLSPTTVNKIASALNEEPTEILYDIMFKEDESRLFINHSKSSLLYLCYLYLNNYNINLDYNVSEKEQKPVLFEGMAYQKRAVNNYTLVDSWKSLKHEHSLMYESKDVLSLFSTQENYYHSVFSYCIKKFLLNAHPKYRYYYIIFDKNDIDSYNSLKSFQINATGFQIIPMLID